MLPLMPQVAIVDVLQGDIFYLVSYSINWVKDFLDSMQDNKTALQIVSRDLSTSPQKKFPISPLHSRFFLHKKQFSPLFSLKPVWCGRRYEWINEYLTKSFKDRSASFLFLIHYRGFNVLNLEAQNNFTLFAGQILTHPPPENF